MQHFSGRVTDLAGNAVRGALVSVTTGITLDGVTFGPLAALYSDDGVTPKANPITTDSSGGYAFYAANGNYTASSGGGSETITLFDPDDLAGFTALMAAWIATLPTTLPGTPGQFWLDGGV